MSKRINIEIDKKIWRDISIRAVMKDATKAEVVNEALEYYLANTEPENDDSNSKD